MAECVVDLLEPVEVDEQKTGGPAAIVATGDDRFQFVVEGATVGQVRQLVMVG